MIDEIITDCTGFDWDDSNVFKNWGKHNVSPVECEQVFFNLPIIVKPDIQHSQAEKRYYVLGQTDSQRGLFIVFTIRNSLIRVVSARDMTKKEKKVYENHEKNT